MRDFLLLSIILIVSLLALKRPWIGVILFTWISIMNPHEQYGYAMRSMPIAMIAALSTIIGLLFSKDRQNPFSGPPVWALFAFTAWICITLPFSIYLEPSLILWERSMKIFLMLFVTLALINDRYKLDVFIWTIVLSLGFYGVKGGIFTIASGGSYRVWGPGGFIGENNAMALAMVMTIPLMRYLQLQTKNRWQQHLFLIAMFLTAIAALGSQSRGALIAISTMSALLWWRSQNKVRWAIALFSFGVLIIGFMPETWSSRMSSISTYQEDSSAMGRINAWWMTFNLAKDLPFGGGFSIYEPALFAQYAPNPTDVHAAHSIYFMVLGEHGFFGLLLFIAIGITTWSATQRVIRLSKKVPDGRWAGELGAMVQTGLVGYAFGGAFLSLAYWDLPYDYMVCTVIALRLLTQSNRLNLDTSPPNNTQIAPKDSLNNPPFQRGLS